ncbi:Molybdopterin biosynthesis Mog protein2C molybdochelatase [gamma proteobacterium IMCC2047]|nr:Molybdopterin biosynthesis Mog protein2C molybdochelatase [gamma proteobacterium IMCC2047]
MPDYSQPTSFVNQVIQMTAIISVGIVTVSDRASRGDYEDLGGTSHRRVDW